MKVGVILPTFRDDASAVQAAAEAEELGLDGVFAYDHIWPIARPDRPALSCFPVLGAVAASTTSISVGSLVARVGLLPEQQIIGAFQTLKLICGDRLVAGLGTGDKLNAAENEAYGVPYPVAAERRKAVGRTARTLLEAGIDVWVGAGAPHTITMALEAGATLNLWDVDAHVAAEQAELGPVTWGGHAPKDTSAVTELLEELRDAGVTWAVFSAPGSYKEIAEAARTLH